MREIKFRSAHYSYDGKFEKFTYWGILDNSFVSPSSLNGTIRKYEEQSTGLKDKNGIDIYEGDKIKGEFITVKGNGFGSPKYNKVEGIIEYIESSAQFAIHTHTTKTGCKGYKWFIQLHSMSENRKEVEIIGNIHQNN